MSSQTLKKSLLPAIKGWPIIALFFLVAVLFATRAAYYATPVYEATALLKLDEKNSGTSDNNLFKNFDVFTSNNKILTEEQVIQSQVLIEKTLQQVDFGISYFRQGKIRKSEMYHDTPFLVKYDLKDSLMLDCPFELTVNSSKGYTLEYSKGKYTESLTGVFDRPLTTKIGAFTIVLNEDKLKRKPELQLKDRYEFIVHSKEALTKNVIGRNLDIKAIDKDVAILRISYKSEVAEKTATFVNALAAAYIQDFVDSKSEAAGKTLNFIDKRLDEVGRQLRESEIALEQFKLANNVINTTQETETGLKKMSELQIQLANLDMQEAALDQLNTQVSTSTDFNNAAPSFGAIGDPLFTEMIKNLKTFSQEKRELLTKYTPENEKVKLVDQKIADIIHYTKESISNAKKNIEVKRKELAGAVETASHEFDGLPTKEKEMVVLDRTFQLNQKIYQFLIEKRTEAAIAEAATISFHRILQHAEIPLKPISPNRTMMIIVAAFVGLMLGLAFVYMRRFVRSKVEDKESIEKMTLLPVTGIIKHHQKNSEQCDENFRTLATNLQLLGHVSKGTLITVTSTIEREGKTYTAIHLAKALSNCGWKVLLVDFNLKHTAFAREFKNLSPKGIADFVLRNESITNCTVETHLENLSVMGCGEKSNGGQSLFSDRNLHNKLNELKNHYDVVIADCAATSYTIDALPVMKSADLNLYVIRSGVTPTHMLQHADILKEEYQLPNMHLLLNGMHHATNYSGHFTGSLYGYHNQARSRMVRMRHYLHYYLKK